MQRKDINVTVLERLIDDTVKQNVKSFSASVSNQPAAHVIRKFPAMVQSILPAAWKLKLPDKPTPEYLASAFQLNRKQQLAFFLVADVSPFGFVLRILGL